MTNKCLGAFTPSRLQQHYVYYPPFVNFTQQGDWVRIIVRGNEILDDKGHPSNSPMAEMTLRKEEFRQLLQTALQELVDF